MEVLASRVLYRARDFEALRRFYEQTVGLHVFREYGADDQVRGVVFFLGGGFLELVRAEIPSPPLTLWLQVPDARQAEAELRDAGVEVIKAVEKMSWGLVESWVNDPEGNELRIVEVPDDHPIRRRL